MDDAIKEKAKKIKMLISDTDGCLTTGQISFLHNGFEIKSFHAQDGFGILMLSCIDIKFCVIASSEATSMMIRLERLGVGGDEIYQGYKRKAVALDKIIKKHNIQSDEICYIGDDLGDKEVLDRVGFSVAVNNAIPSIKTSADYVTTQAGGHGAVREVIDLILEAQGKSAQAYEKMLEQS